jgi:hypothetical protein
MYFQFRKDAKAWFKNITSDFPTDFHLYYLCLMVGFATRRKSNLSASDVTDLVESFPSDFKSKGRLIIGLLLRAEIQSLGISLEERTDVHKTISELLSPQSPNFLSDKGMRLMNQYCGGGFDALCEMYGEQGPHYAETFLRKYIDCIRTARP